MKAIHLKTVTALAMSLSACACIPSVQEPAQTATPAPAPVAAPAPSPAPTPAPVPVVNERAYDNYLDAPQTPGTWQYLEETDETLAIYGTDRRNPALVLSCNNGEFYIARAGASPQSDTRVMSITSETVTRQFAALPMTEMANVVAAQIDVNDPVLDAMAITKGRVAIEVEGMPTLYAPAWVEISRVIEDCR